MVIGHGSTPFEPGSQHPYQVHLTLEDVTARHTAHQRALSVIGALPLGMVAADKTTGRFVSVNDQFCAMLGKPREALLKLSPMDIHPVSDVDDVMSKFWQMVRGEIDSASDIPLQGADGRTIWVDIRTSHLSLDGRDTLVAAFSDVTERRRAEQNYQMLFTEMLEGFALHEIICDPAGRPVDYRFLAVNPAFEEITGLQASQIVGRTVLELMPETEASWIECYGRVALQGTDVRLEDYSAALGKYFAVAAFQPAPGQFACVISDITERKAAELELRKLALAVEQSPANIVITNADAEIEYVNAAFTERTGYTLEEALGTPPAFCIPARHRLRLTKRCGKRWAAGTAGRANSSIDARTVASTSSLRSSVRSGRPTGQ